MSLFLGVFEEIKGLIASFLGKWADGGILSTIPLKICALLGYK